MSTNVQTGSDPNFARLESKDEYAQYFNQLSKVFGDLLGCYRLMESAENCEAKLAAELLRRLLFTISALRVKYTYRSGEERPLLVDLTESGFPNFDEISAVERDLQSKDQVLAELPAGSILKRLLLDHLMAHHEDPHEVLDQLGRRTYLEMLDEPHVFLPFTPGQLQLRGEEEEGVRSYLFSWGCYDFATNRPYVHLMLFDHTADEALEQRGKAWDDFVRVVSTEGARAPDVGILAMAIDDALDTVHPKILKRLCIGPLYSRLLLNGRPENEADRREALLRAVFRPYSRRLDDYVLFFTDEIVFAKRQEVTRSLLAPLGKVRQVFSISDSDPECYRRRASVLQRRVLLPHWLLQNLPLSLQSEIPDFGQARKFTFDEQGMLHGVEYLSNSD